MDGQGELGNEMLRNLSAASETLGRGSEDLFATVSELAEFTAVLGQNDRLVRAFMRDLSGMSAALVSERVEIERALSSVARAVGTVKTFVRDNREAVVTDIEKLTRVVKNINSERESLDTALQVAPLAIGNLAVAFNNQTGTIGSRIGLQGTFGDADGLLCAIVQQSDLPGASKDLACTLFEQLLEPVEGQVAGARPARRENVRLADIDPAAQTIPRQYAYTGTAGSFDDLMGGGRS
jgi:phospholipid/cholesterol/gamma-HCH transport system substrate-binding protein